ncbi:MAG: hypothetical protein ACP5OR_08540 [Candidatus Dormibacteria bacterium]
MAHKSATETFWQTHRERGWELGKSVREAGGTRLEEYATIAGYYRDLARKG